MSGKWDNFEALARKQQTPLGTTGEVDGALAPINQQIDAIRNQEMDLIGRFKRNTIDRRAALESLRLMHEAQLEAAKHALRRAVDVEKQRIDTVADRYIFQITEQYLRNLRELGLQNFESRFDTMLQLNTTMTRLLEKAQAQDVPPSVRDATIENIQKKHKEFSDRLMEDEIKLSK
jgi:hypothetical protein